MTTTSIDIEEIETDDPVVQALVERIKVLEAGEKTPRKMTFEERFASDLALEKVGRAGGRKRDRIARGHAKTYEMLMERVGDQINDHIREHGFSMALFTALIRAYYSRESREFRG